MNVCLMQRREGAKVLLILVCLFLFGCDANVPEEPAVDGVAKDVIGDEPAVDELEPTPLPPPTATAETLRPIEPAGSISDPADQMDEYMNEGLFISHFDAADIGMWQAYSQDTEVTINSGDPPEGYLSVGGWHAKLANRWVQPTDDFELTDDVIFGDGAAHWSDTVQSTRVVIADIPADWSEYAFFTFWAYSEVANDAGIQLAIYSERESTSSDDYYKKEIIIDWEGWRLFEIPLHEFRATREPIGWDKIDYIKIASSGWGHTPDPTTDLTFDELKLSNVRIGPRLAIDLPDDLEHPYLMLNPAEIEEIKMKVEQYDWAKTAYATLQSRADKWLNQPIAVPETGGGFYHDDDATAYAITEQHYALADGARDLALMYQFTDDAAYMEKAKEILLGYADSYLSYEIHDKEGRTGEQASAGGRATAQGINEARWVIPLAWAYDLIFNELSADDHTAIADQILRPAADLMMLNNEGRHNHQAWYNSGVGVIGFILQDKEYVWYALLKDDSSLDYQLSKSVTADGMWYEGSMHYQFYVLRALLPLMEVTHHAGFNVYENPQYKALFDFMVTYADPNLEMPNINDGRVVDLLDSDRATYYELAYRRLGDPRYVPILEQSSRTDVNALLYGVPELGTAETPVWETQNYSASKLMIMRSGEGANSIQATLNYMGYQGGHSHADQLSFVLYGLEMPLAPDAGSVKYRLPEQEGWFKQTVAHNALTIDGASQERAAAATLVKSVVSDNAQMAQVMSEDLYEGVRLQRMVLLNDEYLIDMYDAVSEEPHQYDWVYHSAGNFSAADLTFAPATTSLGEANGYDYLREAQSAAYDDDWQGNWNITSQHQVDIDILGEAGTTYHTAQAPVAARVGDEIAEQPVSVLIARRNAAETQFVSIIQPHRGDATPVTEIPHDSAKVKQIGTELFILSDQFITHTVENVTLDGTMGWISQSDGELDWLLIEGVGVYGDGWYVEQEDLSGDDRPAGMGMYFEIAEPGRLLVQNTFQYASYVVIEGFVESAEIINEYNQYGEFIRTMPTKVNENGKVKFLAHPGVSYEVVGN